MTEGGYRLRVATRDDLDAIRALMQASMDAFLPKYYPADQAEVAPEFMGLDTQLVDDATYFVVEDGEGRVVGSGGWGKRATLFGGDASPRRSAALLDPKTDAARVRAMYTHPDHARRGIGRMVIDACERAAADAGFTRTELGATLPGVPLYEAVGYKEIERSDVTASNGVVVPVIRMGKAIG